jgi:hypothetical protein
MKGITDKMLNPRSKSIEMPFFRGALLLLLLVSAACGGGGNTALSPQVVKTDPGNEAGNVPVNASIRATFSSAVDPVTVNKETFIVSGIDGTVQYQDQTAIFTPSTATPLAEGKKYYVVLTTGIKDLDGISLPSNFSWSFETSGLPSVESVDPKENAAGTPVAAPITVLFSKSIDPGTVNARTFFIRKEGSDASIGAAIAYDDAARTATLDPSSPLAFSTKYTVTVTTGVKDRTGNPLSVPKTWSFITAEVPDTKPPQIKLKSPEANATTISTNTSVSVTFDEPIDAENLKSKFFVRGPGGPIAADLTLSQPTITLNPAADLDFQTKYDVVVTGIRDVSGNQLPSDITWSFTTGKAPDHTAPAVVGRNPDGGSEGVPVKTKIAVQFSEPMDAGSVTLKDNFTLFRLRNNRLEKVAGTTTYEAPANGSSFTAIFTPSERLQYLATYQVFLKQLKDAAGNPLVAEPWAFTAIDAPKVESTSPAASEANVASTALVTVRFSRGIKPESISPASFKIEGGPGGTFTFPDAQTVTLTPEAPLADGTTYQVTLTPAIEDTEGNPLESPYVWFFTTAAQVVSPPQVVSTDPVDGATGSSVQTARLLATFDMPIDPASLPGRYTVVDSDGVPASGSVDQSSGAEAIFSFPVGSALLYNTWYRATLWPGIQSASHASSTDQPYFWCFRTEPDPTMAPPPETGPPEWCARPGR